jgi:hypothetical protein
MRFKIFLFLFIFIFLFYVGASDYGDKIETEGYVISREKIERSIELGSLFTDSVSITNLRDSPLEVSFSVDGAAYDFFSFDSLGGTVMPSQTEDYTFLIKGKELGTYSGNFYFKGGVEEILPINLSILEGSFGSPFLLETKPLRDSFNIGRDVYFQIIIKKLEKDNLESVGFSYSIIGNNQTYELGKESKQINGTYQFMKDFPISENLSVGTYVFEVTANYSDFQVIDKVNFSIKKPFFQRFFLGFIPMWLLTLIFGVGLLSLLIWYLIKKNIEGKKKYQMKLDLKTLPKKNEEFFFLGKIAETNHEVYLDPGRLTTHSIVAGATGGGKSISAQVIIEEALKKNISVVVFDPTAQWSGMLRKCTDKKMISYYSKFGLKPTDARAFKGNVRQVENARQIIDINKYIEPGQIQIFSLNKLQPKDMDIFVANVIRQIFKGDPKESPVLKTLVVFDEVHRLLPKFGGNGQGFLQIERACREFRKWGLGVMLVSQVLADFVGEIKANISTEVQMRTRDEGDLGRIKTKYGETFLQSLVKASVGVGMFSNPAYNHAKPYFVNFRPILHSTRRLPDEELEKYNKYNDLVDDLEDSVLQLEKEKVDTFDLKMELKLIKDKIMSGSFSVVEIYLEGLSPRVDKEWEKLGKKPKKRVIQVASEEEIQKSIQEAKEQHEKAEARENKVSVGKKEAEEKKAKLEDKQVPPLTFDNGIMIGSVKELKDYLPTMDESIFKIHVNEEKNDIHKWIQENFGPEEGSKVNVKTKSEMIEALKSFDQKPDKKAVKKEVKKESPSKQETPKENSEEKKDSAEKKK